MIEIQPPNGVEGHYNSWPKVFLAGSIEMNRAVRWQEIVVDEMKDIDGVIFNPRRRDWDSSWKQSMSEPNFLEQVNWELDSIQNADIVGFYFDPNTASPVTLMELGMFVNPWYTGGAGIIVCCPDGYWRKGNVEIACKRVGITVIDTLEDFIDELKLYSRDLTGGV